METQAHDWNRIAAYYQRHAANGGGDEMLLLVQHIISSGASSRLFAFTSVTVLKVSIYELMHNNHETLHIHFDSEKQVFQFRYYATENTSDQPEFCRQYSAGLGIEKFDQFIRWIQW